MLKKPKPKIWELWPLWPFDHVVAITLFICELQDQEWITFWWLCVLFSQQILLPQLCLGCDARMFTTPGRSWSEYTSWSPLRGLRVLSSVTWRPWPGGLGGHTGGPLWYILVGEGFTTISLDQRSSSPLGGCPPSLRCLSYAVFGTRVSYGPVLGDLYSYIMWELWLSLVEPSY